ncbi:MAG: hypothetical protein NTV71_04820 [Candidatus Omnitrophica bacterium]|nr:hypothetical protein [Candidatus Omnitrophota bacterium]
MDDLDYIKYKDKKILEHENLCKRCGACCGVQDKDPCEHLKAFESNKYFCDIYENRFGLRKTVSGQEITCVPIRNILHKTWWGRSACSYIKYGDIS